VIDSRIFLAAVMESVITMMSWILSIFIARMSPVQIVMSLASRDVMFMELTYNSLITMLSD